MNCVYCGRRATTRDHVPPRCLLEKLYPQNLKTVPCCRKCNNSFSLDEQYFLILLGQIETIPPLTKKVEQGGIIDRALMRALALNQRIIESLAVSEDGRIMFQPEVGRVHRVIQKIALLIRPVEV